VQFQSSYPDTLYESSNSRLSQFDSKDSLTLPTGPLDVFKKRQNTVISLDQFTFEHCSTYSIKQIYWHAKLKGITQ